DTEVGEAGDDVNEVIPKPFKIDELEATIQELLRERAEGWGVMREGKRRTDAFLLRFLTLPFTPQPSPFSHTRHSDRLLALAWFLASRLHPPRCAGSNILTFPVAPGPCRTAAFFQTTHMLEPNLLYSTRLLLNADDDPEQSIPLPTADQEKEMSTADV